MIKKLNLKERNGDCPTLQRKFKPDAARQIILESIGVKIIGNMMEQDCQFFDMKSGNKIEFGDVKAINSTKKMPQNNIKQIVNTKKIFHFFLSISYPIIT